MGFFRMAAGAVALSLALPAGAASGAGSFTAWRVDHPEGVANPGAMPHEARDAGERHVLTHQGRERSYRLHIGGRVAGARPVVLLLHAAGRDGRSMIEMWQATADRHGVALVAPDAVGEGWDVQTDGPDFLIAALNDAARRTPLDAARLHMFGDAEGAVIAILYANRAPGPWKSVAAHGGVVHSRAVAPAAPAAPIRMYLGAENRGFRLEDARASGRALAGAGHVTELVEIEGHAHRLDRVGPWLSKLVWTFFDGPK